MNLYPDNIDPKLRALSTEGIEDYIFWSQKYTEISDTYVKLLKTLKRLQIQDSENDYSPVIAQTFGKAFLHNMEWEIKRHSILTRWLRNEHDFELGLF